jgi:hypothetical protein
VSNYSLSHLADHVLVRDLVALASKDRLTTAALLAHLAEVDDRKLYLPAAYPSMYLYCVRELRMSEDTAFKRIRVARIARQFPAIFSALADGRLNMCGVALLAPHLTPKLPREAAEDLLAAAANKANPEIEQLLAERFPQPDVPTLVHSLAAPGTIDELTLQPVAESDSQQAVRPVVPSTGSNAMISLEPLASPNESRAKLTPLSLGRFALQLTVNQTTHDLLRYAQSLLGHTLPSGDVSQVIERALVVLVEKLEKQKFAKCARSRPDLSSGRVPRGVAKGRHVPADVRRTVWERDDGQCTFVSDRGHRCEARTRLEFDHIDEVARGGQTNVAGIRLRCRAHNQFTAACTFGAGFMQEKREAARCKAAQAKEKTRERAQEKANERAGAKAEAKVMAQQKPHEKTEALVMAKQKAKLQAQEKAQESAQEKARSQAAAEAARQSDVVPWLRQLGFTIAEARRGAARCADIPDAPLEQRVRVALQALAPNCVRQPVYVTSAPA